MPALVACGRTWEFGSDDLFYPCLAATTIRIMWLIGTLGSVIYFRNALWCQHSHYLMGFAAALLILTLLAIIVEALMTIFSARGTIIHTKPRKPVVHLLHFRTLLFILEIVLLVLGTVFAFKSQEEKNKLVCPNLGTVVLGMQIIVGAYWCVLFLFLLVIVIYLDPCHCFSAKVNYSEVTKQVRQGNVDETVIETQWRLNHSVWEKRFRVACCIAGSDDTHQLAYREVAEIFAHLFCDTNVVLSDIGAGLILLQKEQLAAECKQQDTDSEDGDNLLSFDFHHPDDRQLFKDALHFMRYALGMYSWPFYVYMNPFCGLCRLYSQLRCCCKGFTRVSYSNVEKDNGCFCHLGGLREVTGLNEVDIIYVSFKNDLFRVPFLVCLDHDTQSVVVAFRGTLSFTDIVTDFSANTPKELPNFPNFLVHKGMLKTVQGIMELLEEENILETAFSKVNNYRLVVVGHSLGAGCACLMSVLLREKYPNVRCFCYSPTGALVNDIAAEYTEEFVTSITLGKDLVARLSVPNSHKLKEDLVRVIESCHKPKCQIIIEGCLDTLSTCFGGSFDQMYSNTQRKQNELLRNANEDDEIDIEAQIGNDQSDSEANPLIIRTSPSSPHVSIPSRLASTNVDESLEYTPLLFKDLESLKLPVRSTRRSTSPASPVTSLTTEVERRLEPLYIPGKIIHLVDTSEQKPCFFGSRQIKANWASKRDFGKILVSPEMIRDHFPDVLYNAMNKIWKSKMEELDDSIINRPLSTS